MRKILGILIVCTPPFLWALPAERKIPRGSFLAPSFTRQIYDLKCRTGS